MAGERLSNGRILQPGATPKTTKPPQSKNQTTAGTQKTTQNAASPKKHQCGTGWTGNTNSMPSYDVIGGQLIGAPPGMQKQYNDLISQNQTWAKTNAKTNQGKPGKDSDGSSDHKKKR